MPVYSPNHLPSSANATVLVACLCAAWCNTCKEYQVKFNELSERYPNFVFFWIDIEEHSDLLDDIDIENFPTILIQDAAHSYFFGTQLPHIEHLERMLKRELVAPKTALEAPQLYHRLVVN